MRLRNGVALLLTLFCGWFIVNHILFNYDVTTAGGDFAEWVNNAYRFLDGDKPQKDFWLLFPAGEVIFPALLLKWFGLKLQVLIVAVKAVRLAIVFASVLIVWKLTKNFLAASFILVLQLFNGNPDVYFLFQILCALFLVFFLTERKNYLLLLCGLFAGLSVWFRIYQSAPVVIAAAVTLWIDKESRKRILYFIVPFGVIASALFIYYSDDFVHAMNELFIQSVQHNASLDLPYFNSLGKTLRDDVLMWNWTVSEPQTQKFYGMFFLILKTIEIALYYFSPLLLLVFVPLIIKMRRADSKQFSIHNLLLLFFTIWFLLFLPYGIVRAEVNRIEHIAPPLYFALILIYFSAVFQHSGRMKVINAAFLILLTGCIVFRIYGERNSLNIPKYTVVTLNGTYRETSNEKAESMNNILRIIDERSKKGEYIFYDGFNSPPLYFLSGRRNPAYYDSMIDVVARPSEAKQNGIIAALQSKQAKIYIHARNFMYDKMPERSFGEQCLILKKYLSVQKVIYTDSFYKVYQLE